MKLFSEISLFWSIPWGFLSVFIAFWYYRKQKQLGEISRFRKGFLTSLRGGSIFLLGLILFGILIETTASKTEKPVFITLVDNSSSMLNYKDSVDVKKNISTFYDDIENEFGERFEIVNYIVDSKVSTSEVDYSGQISNLNKGFDFIYNQYYNRNIGGICFFSDGNYNQGINPVYTSDKINLTPIFTVGVGDTVPKKDHSIVNVTANNIAFYGNEFPVEVDVKGLKMGRNSYNLSLFSNGKEIATKRIDYKDGQLDFQHISFLIEAKSVGFISYSVKLEAVSGEYTFSNNVRNFYVEVIDSRSKILLLADAPHPDITAFKQVISKDENMEAIFSLVKDWNGNTDGAELVVLFGAGKTSMSKTISGLQSQNIPLLYFLSNSASSTEVDKLRLGLSFPSGSQTDQVQAFVKDEFNLFEISDYLKTLILKSPPLHVKFGEMEVINGSVLLAQKIGPVKKDDPILFFGKSAKNKIGVITAEGIWRWKIFEFSQNQSNQGFSELINKTVQYLILKNNKEALQINLPKRYTEIDEVLIGAEFYNASLELITTPDVKFELVDENGDRIKYEFGKTNTSYKLSLGKLKEGKYTWSAFTTHAGEKYNRSGVFVVENISLESLSTNSDHNLLKQIAQQSNGDFYSIHQLNELLNDIGKRKDIVNVSYQESSFNDLIDLIWLFVLIAASLSLEWFFRRYFGTY